jgi:DNA helicase II / ATP-dependent DNA helicase PcrA
MALNLTEEQQAVVNHPLPGHGRVLAGPGTGKSTTAAALAERLLAEDHPLRLKFLTFTRAATAELTKKLSAGQAKALGRPSTIHSFSISTLLRNPGCASFPAPLRIPDDFEYHELIRPHLARRVQVGLRKLDKLVAEMAAMWESLIPEEHSNVTCEERAKFMGAWLQHRRTFGYTLLQELPDLFRCALRDHDDLNGVDYDLMIVDEYQDLNACDLEVLQRLAKRAASVLAIGDDDQSIYSFRKAHPAGIRRFLEDYSTNHDYKLTICHRSPRSIIEWAQHVVQGDLHREKRNPPQHRNDAPDGVVALLRFRGDRSEAKGVADLVTWLRDAERVPTSEILILSRTDRSGTFTNPIKEELSGRRVPISDPSVVEAMLAEDESRRLIAHLRLLAHRTDSLAWWSLLNLRPGVGGTFVDYIFNRASETNTTFGEAFIAAATEGFVGAPRSTVGPTTALWNEVLAVIDAVRLPGEGEATQWGKWIVEGISAGRLPPCSDPLAQLLIQINDVTEVGEGLGRFLSQVQPIGEDLMRAQSEGVRFMTMAGSKGLTVRAAIIVGVDNDLIPRPDQDLAEERRLLYVAMTRSQEFLFLTWANKRRGPAARSGRANIGRRQPSDFLRGGPVESQDGHSFIHALNNEA